MNEESLYQEIVEFCRDERDIPEERVRLDSSFVDDLGLDSLDVLEMLVVVEHRHGIVVDERQARMARTVADAVALVLRCAATGADAAVGAIDEAS